MQSCPFCIENEIGENEVMRCELFWARWDIHPSTPGHVLIIPVRHVQFFEELTDEELSEMMLFCRDVMQRIRDFNLAEFYESWLQRANDDERPFIEKVCSDLKMSAGSPTAMNLGLNDGPAAGQSVPHLHLHIMPRWEGDVEKPRGGVRNMFGKDAYSENG